MNKTGYILWSLGNSNGNLRNTVKCLVFIKYFLFATDLGHYYNIIGSLNLQSIIHWYAKILIYNVGSCLYQVMLHKAIKFKSNFWAVTASGLLPTSTESFTVICRKKSVAGVLLLAYLCFRIYGILSFFFSTEAFIKCCYSPICIVNNCRLKYKRWKEFLIPADSEQMKYIILMLIAEKNDAL